MSKYNKELKLKVVKYIIEEFHSTHDATRKFNIENKAVQKWVRKYIKHGIAGLIKNNTKYDGEFKNNVIEYMHANHLSLSETAIIFNLSGSPIVGKWERIYYEEGPQALYEE